MDSGKGMHGTDELWRKATRAGHTAPASPVLTKETPSPGCGERAEGRGHRLLIACLSTGPQGLGTLGKNGIWLVGEHEREEEVTQFSMSMSQNPGLELQPPGPG